MKVEFLLAAEIDIQRAYDELDALSEGLGDSFVCELEAATSAISQFPLSCRAQFDAYRRMILHRYPYGLFYVIETDRIVIHAVMNLRQNPETIRRRLLGWNG